MANVASFFKTPGNHLATTNLGNVAIKTGTGCIFQISIFLEMLVNVTDMIKIQMGTAVVGKFAERRMAIIQAIKLILVADDTNFIIQHFQIVVASKMLLMTATTGDVVSCFD